MRILIEASGAIMQSPSRANTAGVLEVRPEVKQFKNRFHNQAEVEKKRGATEIVFTQADFVGEHAP
jgi:hypothetical protein